MLSSDRYTIYDSWAWLYNQTMGPDYGKNQYELLERVLLPHIPTQSHLLDLCCGTGQLISPLLENGYRVTGLDGSEEMLRYATENAPEADFVLEDARTFVSPEAYEAVFSTSASLNHVMDAADLRQIFTNIHQSLKPGGLFVFDLNHPGQMQKWWRGQIAEAQARPNYAWMLQPHYDAQSSEGAFKVSMFKRDAAKQPRSLGQRLLAARLSILMFLQGVLRRTRQRLGNIAKLSEAGIHWSSRSIDFPVKGHPIDQVCQSLEAAGFQKIQVETIDGQPTVDDNHSAHFICRKEGQL